MYISPSIMQALKHINTLLAGKKLEWLVGGSCGLLLQGVALPKPPRDLDIYVDASSAPIVYEALKPYAIDQLQYSTTDIYISLLSHFQLMGVSVEIVGGFEVHVEQSEYKVDVGGTLLELQVPLKMNDIEIGLMPLAHEFIFNLLRDRPDRYLAIAAHMRTNPVHTAAFDILLNRNKFSPDFLTKAAALLDLDRPYFK